MSNIDLTTLTIPELEDLVRQTNAELRVKRAQWQASEPHRMISSLEDMIDAAAKFDMMGRRKRGIEVYGKWRRVTERDDLDEAVKVRLNALADRILIELLEVPEETVAEMREGAK